jgi:multiple sugar transport system substrate-binding protein
MMKMARKALCICMAAAISASLLSACSKSSGSSSAASKASSADSTKPVTLRVSWWGSQSRTNMTIQVLNLYSKEHPNVTFQPEYSDWGGYWDKMATEAASNSMPDVMQQDYSYLDQYASKKQIVALDKYISNKTIDLTNVSQAAISSGKIGGKVVGISLGQNCPVLMIDPDALKKAGIAESEIPDQMTWTQYKTFAKTIFAKTGLKACIPSSNGAGSASWGIGQMMDMMARDMGETMFSADGKTLTISKNTMYNYFSLVETGVKEGWALGMDKMTELTAAGQDPVGTGSTWTESNWSNGVVNSDNQAKKNLIIKMIPKLDNAKKQSEFIKASQLFSVTASSKHPDAAAAFISYFTNSIDANKILKAERGVPISTPVANAILSDSSTSSYSKDTINFVLNTAKIATAIEPATPSSSTEIGALGDQFVQKIMYGKMTAKDAADQFYTQAKAIAAR